MKTKTVNSQLSNYKTYLSYKDRMIALATNVFQFDGIDPFIDMSKINYSLLSLGSVAFFKDDETGQLMASPYVATGFRDFYGRPQFIKPIPYFGAYNRTLYKSKNEFVIMYDNEARIPLLPQILESAERLALIKRTIDVNVRQQLTNRIWEVPEELYLTYKKMFEQIDSNVENIAVTKGIDVTKANAIMTPAPFVVDKLNEAKKEEWSEFLELIGIANNSINKKERLITDEVFTSMGGTIANRYNRFESRRKAIEEINKVFETDIKVSFYDGLPATIKNPDEFLGVPENNDSNKGDEVDDIQ